MDGIEGALTVVVGRIEDTIEAKVAALRDRYGIDPGQDPYALPDVLTVRPWDARQLGIEEYPAVLVSGLETLSIVPADHTPEGVWYVCTYRLRAFVYARGAESQSAQHQRNRLTLALRELLLERKSMVATLKVVEGSVRESMSDTVVDPDGALAGSFIEFTVEQAELLAREPLGTIAEPVQVTGHARAGAL